MMEVHLDYERHLAGADANMRTVERWDLEEKLNGDG